VSVCEHAFVSSQATILHADLDAFFASVEQRDQPALRDRPVIVGGGVVLAASYEARAFGVRTAMGGWRARRLCPDAVVVSPRMSAYSEASKAVFAVFDDMTPLVEGLSIDEAFLDVRGLGRISGPPRDIAERLKERVLAEVGLRITVGVARTKFLAKVASGVAKPDGLLVVPPAGELAFLHLLPVERLWGVGPVTARKLHALARNRDPRRVVTRQRRRSIGSQRALGRRRRSAAELDAVLVAIVDRLGRRLRTARRACRTVVLRLRFDDFSRATRSSTLAQATTETPTILATARGLLAAATPMIHERGLTLLGLSLSNLQDDSAIQLVLPFDIRRAMALDVVLDSVRERYGAEAITRAVLLGRDQGVSMPLLPD
jgi:DNA polymerase-4